MTRHKAFRLKNKKYRNAARKRNYHKGRPAPEVKARRTTGVKHRPWSDYEIEVIMDEGSANDFELGIYFGRSVQAIQTKRYQIKKAAHGK